MTGPAPALLVLRAQVDRRWPRRSRASDGIMGDRLHRLRWSAHNFGNALDLTHDPIAGPDLERLVIELARQMRAAPDVGRLRKIIWNRRVWEGPHWTPRRYRGVNGHTKHAHIEVKPTHRGIERAWRLP